MENKIECAVLLLPSTILNRDTQTIYKNSDGKLLHTHSQTLKTPYSIYLISDEQIKVGDWFYCSSAHHAKGVAQLDSTRHGYVNGRMGFNKIEASTDYTLGVPAIPEWFIEDFVKTGGALSYVYFDGVFGAFAILEHTEKYSIQSNFIKELYTREEVMNIMNHYANYPTAMLNEGYNHPKVTFPTTYEHNSIKIGLWLDLNYPTNKSDRSGPLSMGPGH